MTTTQAEPTPANRYVKIVAGVATLGALLFGYDTGVMSGALPFMSLGPQEGGLGLTPLTEGIVTSALVFGAAFGAIGGGRLADRFGRTRTIATLAVLFFIGALGAALAPSVGIMIAFRVVLGLAVGGASATVPMFIAEMAAVEHRGRLVTRNELMIVSGQLLAYTTNAALANFWPGAHVWRYMLGIATIPAVMLWIGILKMPESPRWLASKGRFDEALAVLTLVREKTVAKNELGEIKDLITSEADLPKSGWRDVQVPWVRRIVLIGIVLGVTVQLTGVNTIMTFAPTILMSTGLGTTAALTATIANGVASVLATLYGMHLMSKYGRRPMWITGQSGLVASLFLLGFAFLLPESTFRSYLVLALMLVFLFFMQTMVGTMFWLVMSEMFPLRMRGFAMGVAIFAQWISNGVVVLTFPTLISTLGGTSFFFFAVINVGTVLFLVKFLPETRGRSLEAIEEMLRNHPTDSTKSAAATTQPA
jgi:MFS transporter, SP family, major inositol transporter